MHLLSNSNRLGSFSSRFVFSSRGLILALKILAPPLPLPVTLPPVWLLLTILSLVAHHILPLRLCFGASSLRSPSTYFYDCS
jgi:ABC-type tungstate transport system substrate-binding protein